MHLLGRMYVLLMYFVVDEEMFGLFAVCVIDA